VLQTGEAGPVIVITSEESARRAPDRVEALTRAGATVDALIAPTMSSMLGHLTRYDVTAVLLEGGTIVHRAAWREGVIDRLAVFVTPHVLGGDGIEWLDANEARWPPHEARVTAVGPDVLLEADVHRID
jgi:riboflavin biosynthesis pyrimidine reductase